MKVVELYIMRRALGIFAATLFWVLAIVWTTQVLTRINVVTADGQSAATFFEIAWLVLPAVIPVVIPFAVGIAVAQTLSTMNTDSELVVLSAAGSPRTTVIRPMMIIAVASSILAFSINNFVEPYSRERLRNVLAEARSDLITTVIQEGRFEQVDDGLVIQIGERLPDGRLGGIFVSDTREEDVELIYYARQGIPVEFEGQHLLVMENGVVHRENRQGEISVVRYQSYALDLSEFSPAASGPIMRAKDRTIAYLMNPDPDDRIYRHAPQNFRAELHRRFSEWLYPMVFALIALAVAGDSRSFREARIHPLLTTMTIALIVRWAGFVASGTHETTPSFVAVVYAVPFGAAAVAAYFIATHRIMELPASATDRAAQLLRNITSRVFGRGFRLARSGASSGGGA